MRKSRKNTSSITIQLKDGSVDNIINEINMNVRKVKRPCAVVNPKKDTINTTSNVTKKKSIKKVLFIGGCSVIFGVLLYAYTHKKNQHG